MKVLNRVFLALSIFALVIAMLAPLETAKAQGTTPLFHVTIIAPGNANLVRRQWAQIFASSLNQLGIDAKVVYLGWTPVYDRVLTPALADVGKTWDQGGWDILNIGWTPGLLPEPRQLFYGSSDFFAPNGQNYPLWNNPQANQLLDTFITSTDNSEKASVLKQWQELFYNEVPASQIMYQAAPAVVNPHITNLGTPPTGGEGWLYFNAQPTPELLGRNDGKTSIVYCSTGEITSLIPPTSNSWYDTIIWAPIFNGLAQDWPTLNSAAGDLNVPALLTSWSHSADGFTWTFNCRQNVKWHDGVDFTADDVVYSLWALMNPDVGSQFVGYYRSVYGDNCKFTFSDGTSVTLGNGTRVGSIKATDKYTVQATLPVLTLGKPYGYFEPYLLTLANNIIPKHIFENIAAADWAASPFNTGQGQTTIKGVTYTGPVGTGPYKWVSFDPVAQLVHLQRFDQYWNATGLQNIGAFTIKDYYIKFIADKTSALAALKNGEVDMLDSNYQMQVDIPSIDPSWGRVLLLDGTGRQEIGYNMQHPIFGTGVDTPLGKSDPSRAAEAARDVRTAFDYAIPRQLIINNLLSGFGQPGVTPMLPTQPFYDSSLTARPYDLSQAKAYLEKAGYTVPGAGHGAVATSLIVGGAQGFAGYYTDASGNPITKTDISFMETTDNTTYTNSTHLLAKTTTGLDGFYSFVATPTTTGDHFYYIFDSNKAAGSEYTYLGMLTVTSLSDQINSAITPVNLTLVYALAAVAIVLSLIAIVIALMKRK